MEWLKSPELTHDRQVKRFALRAHKGHVCVSSVFANSGRTSTGSSKKNSAISVYIFAVMTTETPLPECGLVFTSGNFRPAAIMIRNAIEWAKHKEYQYRLITGLNMLEPWERRVFSILLQVGSDRQQCRVAFVVWMSQCHNCLRTAPPTPIESKVVTYSKRELKILDWFGDRIFHFTSIDLTLSLLRVINVKIPLQNYKKYDITQYGELDFS